MANGPITPGKQCEQCGKVIAIRKLCNACFLRQFRSASPERVRRYREAEAVKRGKSKPVPCVGCQDVLVTRPRLRCAPCAASHARQVAKEVHYTRAKARHSAEPRKCRECEVTFTPEYGDKRRNFCSNECSYKAGKRVARLKNKARKRAVTVEPVDPIKVFNRDGWRCHLCGCKTPKEKRGTYHPKAPELDHIVPLSKGGEHSYRNTACACRACNAAKSDKILGQPSLLAA